jgi:hypothetical protein
MKKNSGLTKSKKEEQTTHSRSKNWIFIEIQNEITIEIQSLPFILPHLIIRMKKKLKTSKIKRGRANNTRDLKIRFFIEIQNEITTKI